MPKNWCFRIVVLEKTLEHSLDSMEIKPVSSKGNQSWVFIERTDAEAEAAILWLPAARSRLIRKRPWCWERLRADEEVGERRRDDWMVSPTQWTWVWANSGRQWRTGKPGLLQFMGLQWVRHDLVNEWTTITRKYRFHKTQAEPGPSCERNK